MTRLTWDPAAAPPVKVGLDRGVLYFRSHPVAVWNGLMKMTEKGEGDAVEGYFDGQKFVQVRNPESFSATVEAFTYPDALELGDAFDLSYRVMLETGYEIHIVYNARVKFQDESWEALSSSVGITPFSWDLSSIPVKFNEYRASAHVVINSNNVDPTALQVIENALYGTATTNAGMPSADGLFAIFEAYAVFKIVDNGDGTWTATGPDSWFTMLDATTFQIVTPSAEYVDADTYRIRSW